MSKVLIRVRRHVRDRVKVVGAEEAPQSGVRGGVLQGAIVGDRGDLGAVGEGVPQEVRALTHALHAWLRRGTLDPFGQVRCRLGFSSHVGGPRNLIRTNRALHELVEVGRAVEQEPDPRRRLELPSTQWRQGVEEILELRA